MTSPFVLRRWSTNGQEGRQDWEAPSSNATVPSDASNSRKERKVIIVLIVELMGMKVDERKELGGNFFSPLLREEEKCGGE
jgi:hypothetical protein